MADKTDEEKAAEAKAAAEKKAAEEKAAAEKAAKAAKVKARVLVDGDHGKINDIVSLTPEQAEAAVAAGWADTSPAAVAYAKENPNPKADADQEAISE